jgi:hypothetical protein
MTARTSKLRGFSHDSYFCSIFTVFPSISNSSSAISFSISSLLERYLTHRTPPFKARSAALYHLVHPLLGMHLLIPAMLSPKSSGCLLYAAPDCRPIIASVGGRFQSVIPEVSLCLKDYCSRCAHQVLTYITRFCFGWQAVVKSAVSLLPPLKWHVFIIIIKDYLGYVDLGYHVEKRQETSGGLCWCLPT